MEVSDEDSEKSKVRQLRRGRLDRKKWRGKEKMIDGGELAKNKEDQGESSTSSAATVSGKRTAKKARKKRNASQADYIVTERLYEQVEVRSLLTVANDYEKVFMELVRENARLSGRIEELEKDKLFESPLLVELLSAVVFKVLTDEINVVRQLLSVMLDGKSPADIKSLMLSEWIQFPNRNVIILTNHKAEFRIINVYQI
uniref:Uncharacterized protein n=1 Tax=Glossina palpalis gambiensis TaxID=67801 RepID=A0A1B0B1V4_9MUSC